MASQSENYFEAITTDQMKTIETSTTPRQVKLVHSID